MTHKTRKIRYTIELTAPEKRILTRMESSLRNLVDIYNNQTMKDCHAHLAVNEILTFEDIQNSKTTLNQERKS